MSNTRYKVVLSREMYNVLDAFPGVFESRLRATARCELLKVKYLRMFCVRVVAEYYETNKKRLLQIP